MNCRHCFSVLEHVFVDLGSAPPSNAYLSAEDLNRPETYFPLKVYVCSRCWLVQTGDNQTTAGELFDQEYAYFSSVSRTWLDHASRYADMIVSRLNLGPGSFVIEIGSNDGYLLKNFLQAGIPCLGFEPTASTASVAESLGIPIVREFFGKVVAERLAATEKQADLLIGNNVYAHVPNINDFTAGLKAALKPRGTITLEFPHLMRLIEQTQFDTIYHEHFSYLSLYTASLIFSAAGLRVWDVEQLPTHGGSLRIYGCHADDPRETSNSVAELVAKESQRGLRDLSTYSSFQMHAAKIKDELLLFLIKQKCAGRRVAGYGAAAKGNTLLNYAGVKPDLLPYVCDAAASKQGKFLPGSHIPIVTTSVLIDRRPDLVLILPWNIANEILAQERRVRDLGTVFAVAIPQLRLLQ